MAHNESVSWLRESVSTFQTSSFVLSSGGRVFYFGRLFARSHGMIDIYTSGFFFGGQRRTMNQFPFLDDDQRKQDEGQ